MSTNDYPISIRFVGPTLKTDGVPISDLGESLIALQRMVHKAYLISAGRPFRRAVVRGKKRQALALQIADRERESDMYHLGWLSQDMTQVPANVITELILFLGRASWPYIKKKVGEKFREDKVENLESETQKVDALAVKVYNEFREIASQIDPERGIEYIEIKYAGHKEPIIIDEHVKAYVQNLEGMLIEGESGRDIIGRVDKAHTFARNCVEAKIRPRYNRVRILMDDFLFNDLLNDLTDPDQEEFTFTGRARYKIGRSLDRFNEFEAISYSRYP